MGVVFDPHRPYQILLESTASQDSTRRKPSAKSLAPVRLFAMCVSDIPSC
jgi:hypothetical protein